MDFERSWHGDLTHNRELKVEFVFVGQRVSAVVHSDSGSPWPSTGFHQTFSAAIRRLNRACNVRWL
jgi:hypothetical protein